jgi:hypothetical protein
MSNRRKNLSAKETAAGADRQNHGSDRNQALSIVASSTSMMGMSSFTAYTRWHCVHFKLSGFCR